MQRPGDTEHGIAAKFEGIAICVILPADNDVDGEQTAEGLQKDAIGTDGKVKSYWEGEVSKPDLEAAIQQASPH